MHKFLNKMIKHVEKLGVQTRNDNSTRTTLYSHKILNRKNIMYANIDAMIFILSCIIFFEHIQSYIHVYYKHYYIFVH